MKSTTAKGITDAVIATGLISLLSAGAFGAFGALVQYLYLVAKEETSYKVSGLLQYMTMGFFVGMAVSEGLRMFLGETYPGVVLVSGFIFMKILDFLQETPFGKLLSIFIKK